jgi:FKBP-type peptidyl-prolyl cis-trans isomerase (trigger factor)
LKIEIDRANARAARTRTAIQKDAERELKKQFRGLEKAREGARKDAERFRNDLEPVVDNLVSARNHLAHALRIDKALASIQRELKRRPAEERAKAKVARKKTPAKKVAKKAPARTKAVRKAVVKKQPVAKKPPTDKAA